MASTLYHAMSRGVDKRTIFESDEDYLRFIYDLGEFNNVKSILNNGRSSLSDVKHHSGIEKERLVDLCAFCLMPNHYHLLLSPIHDNGIALFMKKLNGGYVKYFNIKNNRRGRLFETTYKAVPVQSDSHFIHLPYYILANPLDLFDYGWRARNLHDYDAAWEWLSRYRWSSHLDYLGIPNFPDTTQRDLLLDFFNGAKGYQESVQQWLHDINVMPSRNLTLEE
jgi:putative transposase